MIDRILCVDEGDHHVTLGALDRLVKPPTKRRAFDVVDVRASQHGGCVNRDEALIDIGRACTCRQVECQVRTQEIATESRTT